MLVLKQKSNRVRHMIFLSLIIQYLFLILISIQLDLLNL